MQANTSPIPVSVRLPAELRLRLGKLAKIRQKSANSLMVQAVASFVEREEKREAIRQACILAHEEYLRSGLHLTGKEVDDWVDLLLQGDDADMPKCHL